MYKLVIHKLAEDTLRNIKKTNKKNLLSIVTALNELERDGQNTSQIKKLRNTKNIYRKRSGRWRILFTFESSNEVIHIWIIAIEKSTKKDYSRWIQYITYQS